MAGDKRFVYVLRNADQNPEFYVGLTSDLSARVADHNAGRCPHTASRRPWQLHVVIEFPDEQRALRFERYLKSGSGRAFAKRHFEP
jgi:putative endonuclease